MSKHSNFIQRYSSDLLKISNVVGVGLAYDKDGNNRIVVNVTDKLPLEQLHRNQIVPSEVHGFKTWVNQTGIIRAQNIDPTDRFRPAFGGVSIGHPDVTAGTFGFLVRDNDTDRRVILSNNHVLANSNNANIGDPILQPGSFDGGVLNDTIGSLERFVEIFFDSDGGGGIPDLPPGCSIPFSSLVLSLFKKGEIVPQMGPNLVDAAIAMPTNNEDVEARIEGFENYPTASREAEIGMIVTKYGRTTQLTQGTVQQLGATVQVQYGDGLIATFEDQVLTSAMSEGGDSGSIVLDQATGDVVGLLYAGSPQITVLNRFQNVIDELDISLL